MSFHLQNLVNDYIENTNNQNKATPAKKTLQEKALTTNEVFKIEKAQTIEYLRCELTQLLDLVRTKHTVEEITTNHKKENTTQYITIRPHIKGLSKTLSKLLIPKNNEDGDRGFFDLLDDEMHVMVIKIVSHVSTSQLNEMAVNIQDMCDMNAIYYHIVEILPELIMTNEICEFIQRSIENKVFGNISLVSPELLQSLFDTPGYYNDVLDTLRLLISHNFVNEEDLSDIPYTIVCEADEKERELFLQTVKEKFYPEDPFKDYRERDNTISIDIVDTIQTLLYRDVCKSDIIDFIYEKIVRNEFDSKTFDVSYVVSFLNKALCNNDTSLSIIMNCIENNSIKMTKDTIETVNQSLIDNSTKTLQNKYYTMINKKFYWFSILKRKSRNAFVIVSKTTWYITQTIIVVYGMKWVINEQKTKSA